MKLPRGESRSAGQRVLGEQEGAGQHQREDRLPALERELLDRRDVLDARARHHQVQAAEALKRRCDRRPVGLGPAEIGFEGHAGAVWIGGQVDGQHLEPVRHQPLRRGAPDPARGAGDQRDLQISHSACNIKGSGCVLARVARQCVAGAPTGYCIDMRSVAKSLTESYPAEPGSVAQARRRLSEFAAQAGADERQIEAVRLASSEALTNAVLHAYRGEEGRIHVTSAIVEGEVWVLIADDGCGLEPRARPSRPGAGTRAHRPAQRSPGDRPAGQRRHRGADALPASRLRAAPVVADPQSSPPRASHGHHRARLGLTNPPKRGRCSRSGGCPLLALRRLTPRQRGPGYERGSVAAAWSPASSRFCTTT